MHIIIIINFFLCYYYFYYSPWFSTSSLISEESILEFDTSLIVSRTVAKWFWTLLLTRLWKFKLLDFPSLCDFDFLTEFLPILLSLKLLIVNKVTPSPILYVLDFLYGLFPSSIFLSLTILCDKWIFILFFPKLLFDFGFKSFSLWLIIFKAEGTFTSDIFFISV